MWAVIVVFALSMPFNNKITHISDYTLVESEKRCDDLGSKIVNDTKSTVLTISYHCEYITPSIVK